VDHTHKDPVLMVVIFRVLLVYIVLYLKSNNRMDEVHGVLLMKQLKMERDAYMILMTTLLMVDQVEHDEKKVDNHQNVHVMVGYDYMSDHVVVEVVHDDIHEVAHVMVVHDLVEDDTVDQVEDHEHVKVVDNKQMDVEVEHEKVVHDLVAHNVDKLVVYVYF